MVRRNNVVNFQVVLSIVSQVFLYHDKEFTQPQITVLSPPAVVYVRINGLLMFNVGVSATTTLVMIVLLIINKKREKKCVEPIAFHLVVVQEELRGHSGRLATCRGGFKPRRTSTRRR